MARKNLPSEKNLRAREIPRRVEKVTKVAAEVPNPTLARYLNWAMMGVIVISFFICYNYIFDKKVNVNGDNAGYYLLAKSINEGRGYSYANDIWHDAVDTFPPGYPFLLSIFMFISKDIEFLSYINGLFFLGGLLLMYDVAKKLGVSWQLALSATLLTLCNYHLAQYSITTMSEVPYFFFSTLAMWLLMRIDVHAPFLKDKNFYLLVGVLCLTYYIRSLGIALIGGVGLYFLMYKRWKETAVMGLLFILAVAPWMYRGSSKHIESSYRSAIMKVNPYKPELGKIDAKSLVARIDSNVLRYVGKEIPNGLVPTMETNYKGGNVVGSYWFMGILFIGLMVLGLWKVPKYRSMIVGYMAANFAILLLWPYVWFGTRFMSPSIPYMILPVLIGITWLANLGLDKIKPNLKLNGLLFLPLLILYIHPYHAFNKDENDPNRFQNPNADFQSYPLDRLYQTAETDYQPNWRKYFDVALWVKKNTPAGSVVATRKPELFHVFSDRFTVYYPYDLNQDSFMATMKKNQVKYVVLDQLGFSSAGLYLYPVIKDHPQNFKLIYQEKDPDTYLFEFIAP
jgi:hypothetical protein